MVQWQGVPTEEATWEDYDEIVERFPDIFLEDKGILEERGNVETVRKSKRIVERRSSLQIDGSSLNDERHNLGSWIIRKLKLFWKRTLDYFFYFYFSYIVLFMF